MSCLIDNCLVCLKHSNDLVLIETHDTNETSLEEKLKYFRPGLKFNSGTEYICTKCRHKAEIFYGNNYDRNSLESKTENDVDEGDSKRCIIKEASKEKRIFNDELKLSVRAIKKENIQSDNTCNDFVDEKAKRKRKHLSEEQKTIMIDFMEENGDLSCAKFNCPEARDKKRQLLEDLTVKLNSCTGGVVRQPKEWLKSWKDNKSKTKSKATAIARFQHETCNGSATEIPPLTPWERRIIALISPDFIEGIDYIEGIDHVEEINVIGTRLVTHSALPVTVELQPGPSRIPTAHQDYSMPLTVEIKESTHARDSSANDSSPTSDCSLAPLSETFKPKKKRRRFRREPERQEEKEKQQQRKRKHLSEEQKQIMIDFMEDNGDLSCAKFNCPEGRDKKQQLLENLTAKLNSCTGGVVRQPKEWLKSWKDNKSKTKSKATAIARFQHESCNGSATEIPPLTPWERRIIALISPDFIEEIDYIERIDRIEEINVIGAGLATQSALPITVETQPGPSKMTDHDYSVPLMVDRKESTHVTDSGANESSSTSVRSLTPLSEIETFRPKKRRRRFRRAPERQEQEEIMNEFTNGNSLGGAINNLAAAVREGCQKISESLNKIANALNK